MNELDYCTLGMARRLQEAGIVVETEKVWAFKPTSLNPDGVWQLIIKPLWPYREQYPALSMSEAWRLLPEDEDTLIKLLFDFHRFRYGKSVWDMNVFIIKLARDVNNLCELILWLKGQEGEKE